jgi:hypothetical protein
MWDGVTIILRRMDNRWCFPKAGHSLLALHDKCKLEKQTIIGSVKRTKHDVLSLE